MDIDTFISEFKSLAIIYFEEDRQSDLFYVEQFDFGQQYSFNFSLTEDEDLTVVAVHMFSPRMYSAGCDQEDTIIDMKFYSVNNEFGTTEMISQKMTYNVMGTVNTAQDNLPPGDY